MCCGATDDDDDRGGDERHLTQPPDAPTEVDDPEPLEQAAAPTSEREAPAKLAAAHKGTHQPDVDQITAHTPDGNDSDGDQWCSGGAPGRRGYRDGIRRGSSKRFINQTSPALSQNGRLPLVLGRTVVLGRGHSRIMYACPSRTDRIYPPPQDGRLYGRIPRLRP